jgi:DNA helicase-2/ATP-dependent DNA helicase PcrA
MKDILAQLNEQQKQAVCHKEGPLLVFAGAGSGKTRVIIHRVAYLIQQGVKPYEILCLTFTNKAATEMKHRLQTMMGLGSVNIWAGTFHSFGAWFLRREASRIGYPSSFVIYDETDQRSLIRRCIKELNISRAKAKDSTVAWLINLVKDTLNKKLEIPEGLEFDPVPVMNKYEEKKAACGAFDFGDLLFRPCQILAKHKDVREKYQSMFKYILVDEYQDTNMAQYKMLMHLVGKDKNICVVGDDDQSIYGWRGADVANILKFKDDFPNAKVVILEQNYRSTMNILDAASNLIANNRFRAPKRLWSDTKGHREDLVLNEFYDDTEEANFVAHSVEKLISDGVNPTEIGIFYRINAISRVVEESFARRFIPYAVFGGMRFYERREIKDVLAYLRLIANPKDEEALSRVISTPPRGIGAKNMEKLREIAKEKGLGTMEIMRGAIKDGAIKGTAAKGVEEFINIMDDLKSFAPEVDIGGLISKLVDITGLKEMIAAEVDGLDRMTNVRELIASARGEEDLIGFLEQKALISSIDMPKNGDAVSVMTLHMSKGLEFDHVFILGLEEGLLPHARSIASGEEIEEERRLLYVGMTRAKKRAYLSWARVRGLYGRGMCQTPSCFIREIEG